MTSIDQQIADYEAFVTPAVPSPFRLRTLHQMTTSWGIVWDGEIRKGSTVIATVEDRGDGGAVWPRFTSADARAEWEAWLAVAYDAEAHFSPSEDGIAHLMCLEDGAK